MTDPAPDPAPAHWQPCSNPLDIALLGKLMEEAGELTQVAARCLIQGLDRRSPGTGKLNFIWLQEEIADLQAIMAHVTTQLGLDREEIAQRMREKLEFKAPWFDWLAQR